MTEQLRMKELVWFIERLGKELGWSSRYMDLAATTTAAVFRSLDFDEKKDSISVGDDVIEIQVGMLENSLRRLGRTPSTVATYTTTWKRLSSVADGWVTVRGTSSEQAFWDNIDRFRDTRPKRRHPADDVESGTSDGDQDAWKRIEVPLDDGVAVVTLPHKLNQSEAYRIINAVIAAGAVDPV